MFELFKTKRYGLALGAGGAKGIAYIGVLKALEDLNIKITHISGSSAGSLIGGMYALWGNSQKVEDVVLKYDRDKLKEMFKTDISLTKGVFKGDNLLEELEIIYKDSKVTDCKIPFIAVSVDILSGEKIYHTKGLLKDAIRASCSIPFVFEPYELNGRYLVDGGLAENVPVEAVRTIGAKKVIGVDTQGFPNPNERINLKNLGSRIYRASMVFTTQRDVKLADKRVHFELDGLSLEELLDNAKEYINLGYEETMKVFS
jgi:NTE family protein